MRLLFFNLGLSQDINRSVQLKGRDVKIIFLFKEITPCKDIILSDEFLSSVPYDLYTNVLSSSRILVAPMVNLEFSSFPKLKYALKSKLLKGVVYTSGLRPDATIDNFSP